MKTFTVRRSKWARGGKNGESQLLNDDGCMCCLGFAACQISHLPKDRIDGKGNPSDAYRGKSFLTNADHDPDWGVEVLDNDLSERAISINDNKKMGDKRREERLKKLFRKHGINIKFVD